MQEAADVAPSSLEHYPPTPQLQTVSRSTGAPVVSQSELNSVQGGRMGSNSPAWPDGGLGVEGVCHTEQHRDQFDDWGDDS